MCGIVGYAGVKDGWPADTLRRMRDSLAHRGPDGAGQVRWRTDGRLAAAEEPAEMGLAHRRLSIIDLSAAGAQPMSNEDGSVWITYNGEFYNYGDFDRELKDRGHVFRSRCDTETILHLYEEYGIEKTLTCMNGMYAFALWDRRKRVLWLARDRIGKKPLYYVLRPDGSIFFASEIKALLAAKCFDPSRIDDEAWSQVWAVGCTVGERTIYKDVRRLLPAQYMRWEQGRVSLHEYWDAPFGKVPERREPLDRLADELESLLEDAVRLRLISDVPTGVFLSSGVDSSLIAALAARLTGRQIHTFTIGSSNPHMDESGEAAQIAHHLGLENTNLQMKSEASALIAQAVDHFDEPFGDSSLLPTWAVSMLARRHVTVALTGDGGDELFAGYDSFRQAFRIWGKQSQREYFSQNNTLLDNFWEWRARRAGFAKGFMMLDGKLSRRRRRALFSPPMLRGLPLGFDRCDRDRWLERVHGADLGSQLQYVTLKTWLADCFLRKLDMASMAHALECRSPLLDYRVVEFSAALPWLCKYGENGRGKNILRHILARHLPAEFVDRPKRGFSIPCESWCADPLAEDLRRRWRVVAEPRFQREAASWIFPEDCPTVDLLAWNAYATIRFLEREKAREGFAP